MGRPAKKERTAEQTTDLLRAIDEASELIYGACFKLIRAQDIIVDEEDTLQRLQVAVTKKAARDEALSRKIGVARHL